MKHLFLAAAAMVVLPIGGAAFAQTTTPPTTTAPSMPDQTSTPPAGQTDTMAPATPPADTMTPAPTTGTVTATPPAGTEGTVTATPPADGAMTTQTTPAMPMTTGGDPVGGYQPSGQALSAPLSPGQTATFQPAQSPDQAYPAPAPLASYPVCKAGQFDKCIQRGEGTRTARRRR